MTMNGSYEKRRETQVTSFMPSQMQMFETLYALASRGGCGSVLFGDHFEQAKECFKRTLIGNGYPYTFLEFPLLGEPKLDLLSVYGYVEPGSKFPDGAGFGYQKMFDWFSEVCGGSSHISCGLELDLSKGETETAGVYFQYRKCRELIVPFMESIGAEERAESCLDVIRRMPEGWEPSYIGLFPGREGVPIRIGGYMGAAERAKCSGDPAHLCEQFRRIEFSAFDGPMLERCCEFMRLVSSVDFQFDILQDGSLGDTFGLSLSFNETSPRKARECMESGYGAILMNTLEAWGLADGRWRMLAGVPFARHVSYLRDDGREGRLALCVLFNYAKVKFVECRAQPAKFYCLCKAGDLEDPVRSGVSVPGK